MSAPIPPGEWRWEGHAGHFIASNSCRFRLHTRVGDYRISTVGDYYPASHEGEKPEEIGMNRTHETFVFRVSGSGEGEVNEWSEIDTEAYNDCEAAREGHMAMCRKYAALIAPEPAGATERPGRPLAANRRHDGVDGVL